MRSADWLDWLLIVPLFAALSWRAVGGEFALCYLAVVALGELFDRFRW